MKHYHLIYIIFAVLISCDTVESPYSVNPGISSGTNDTIRKVLLEDHTGHRCQACPPAHATAHSLQSVFGDSLVVITVHAGFWTSLAGPFTYDFTNDIGDSLLSELIPTVPAWPTGTVNRKDSSGIRFINYPDWGSRIRNELDVPPAAFMKVIPSWDASGRRISADVTTTFLQSYSGTARLSVYYTEDSIINWQAFPSPTGNVPDYVHRHVLRGSLNHTFGSVLAVNPAAGEEFETDITGQPIAADIVPEQVHVVAILSDDATRRIIQVEEVKLLP